MKLLSIFHHFSLVLLLYNILSKISSKKCVGLNSWLVWPFLKLMFMWQVAIGRFSSPGGLIVIRVVVAFQILFKSKQILVIDYVVSLLFSPFFLEPPISGDAPTNLSKYNTGNRLSTYFSFALSLCTRFSNFGFQNLFQTRKKIEFTAKMIFFRV